ncbi:MAG TPA: DAK2 domain-containing protein [Anaerolineales bacterium]|nr:DAK2 domain-containing protein [Anaerolineales bacterium]
MDFTEPQVEPKLRYQLLERYRVLDGLLLRLLTGAGLNWLRTNAQVVNALNVFPVPDGDTGTNMTLTMQAAWAEIENLSDRSVGRIAHALAHGALMGARGNSGVILSQLWRGFARSLDQRGAVDAAGLVAALAEARDTAYKGVVRPVEGTILTVSKDVAEGAENALKAGAGSGLEVLEAAVRAAEESVERTPELLPVLKDAGVVDSGGKGLFFILEGMLRAAYRLPLDRPMVSIQPLSALALADVAESVEPGQDWEVVVDFRPDAEMDLPAFYGRLQEMGTSIQVGEGDGIYRMHIHVPDKTQFEPIQYVESLGTITNVHIENLMEQTSGVRRTGPTTPLRLARVEPGQIAVVAVSPGAGLSRIFGSLGVASIVEGGQTMNPSTQDLLNALEALPTDEVLILPNNGNIVMTARQVADLTPKHVRVIATASAPQGVAAMMAHDPNGDPAQVAAAMEEALHHVRTCEITMATRNVEIDGVPAREGQVIGLLDGRLVASGDDLELTLLSLLDKAGAAQAEILAAYYGMNLTPMEANRLANRIRETWPQLEVEVHEGGQPHYPLILSLE